MIEAILFPDSTVPIIHGALGLAPFRMESLHWYTWDTPELNAFLAYEILNAVQQKWRQTETHYFLVLNGLSNLALVKIVVWLSTRMVISPKSLFRLSPVIAAGKMHSNHFCGFFWTVGSPNKNRWVVADVGDALMHVISLWNPKSKRNTIKKSVYHNRSDEIVYISLRLLCHSLSKYVSKLFC